MTIYGPDNRPISSRSMASSGSYEHPIDAARRLGFRPYFYFPTVDSKELLTQPTRDEINRKVAWLYYNVDVVRLIVDGMALEEVDTGLWPKSRTSNPAFSKAVTDAFHEQNKDPRFFSASGLEDFYSSQWMVRRTIRLWGEIFGQMLRPGFPINLPSMHFINGWQCSAAHGKQPESEGWKEGVQRIAQFNRAQTYRFSTGPNTNDFQDVPADDVLHMHDQFWTGQVRGISCLTPVVSKLFSLEEIERLETNGVRLRSRQAYIISREDNGNTPPIVPGASKVEEVKNEDGSSVYLQYVKGETGDVDVATLPAGYKMAVLESNRPSITLEWVKWISQGIANSTLYPSSYVLSLADVKQGTALRSVQKKVQRVKNAVRQFQLIPQYVSRWYTFWLWMRIRAGAFDKIPGGVPSDWWRHKIILPADDTVDVAREGTLYDNRVSTGKMAPSSYHGLLGEDDEDVEEEVLQSRVRRLKRLKELREANPDIADQITYDSIWPVTTNTAKPVDDEPASAASATPAE